MLASEFGRQLPSTVWSPNQPAVVRLPNDCGLKRLNIRLNGSFKVTYASGSPVFDIEGIFSKLVPNIQVSLDGGKIIKSASPFQFQMLHFFQQSQRPLQRYSTSASAFTTRIALTDGKPGAYPATTQYVLDNESVTLFFEDKWAPNFGQDLTILNLKNQTNPELRFMFGSYGAMQDPASASVSVTYANDQALTLDVTTVEAKDFEAHDEFAIFREYAINKSFNSQQTGYAIDLNVGNRLQGILVIVRDGDTTKTLSNKACTRLQLRQNGQTVIKDYSFLTLQDENINRLGLNAPTASSVRFMDGAVYINLMKNGDIRNALNAEDGQGIKSLQLLIDTASSSGNDAATYTANVDVSVIVQELEFPASWKSKKSA